MLWLAFVGVGITAPSKRITGVDAEHKPLTIPEFVSSIRFK